MAEVTESPRDWFTYQAEKLNPKKRPRFDQPFASYERPSVEESMTVEEIDASASMIQRIIGRLKKPSAE